MEEDLYERIGEADLNPTYKDGQVYQHTDINNMLSILKTAINENYYDIQRFENGEKSVGNAITLDEATLSRYLIESLQADDDKIPSSQQVKAYVDALFADFSPPIRGVDYWTDEDKEYVIDEAAELVSENLITFDVVDGKLLMYTTRDNMDYTFQLNDNRLEVVYNG